MPEIKPDDPPAAPIEVSVSPDPAPAEPIEVSVSFDRPPAEPFPVDVNLDRGPAAPIPVETSADVGPRSPVEVPVYPDLGPSEPAAVEIFPDSLPAAPVDVDVYPDATPRDPIEVQISLDPAPRDPISVEIATDVGPRDPVSVEVTRDSLPTDPVPVDIVRDSAPQLPFLVDTFPDAPPTQIRGGRGDISDVQAVLESVKRFDLTLGTFLDYIVELDPVTSVGPGGAALDPRALARWFNDYLSVVGQGGIARFIEQQSILYALNPVVARVFDPTYFLKMLVPGSMGHVKTAADVEFGLTMETVARARDEVLKAAVVSNPLKPGGDGLSDIPDLYGPENTFQQGQPYSVDAMVEAAFAESDDLVGLAPPGGGDVYLKPQDGLLRFDAFSFFQERDSSGLQRVRATAKTKAAAGVLNVFSSKLAASNALDGVVRVRIPGESEDGSVSSDTQNPSDVISDDDTRVPISFTDLRRDPVTNSYRSVYFRPLNVQFAMAISPEYSEGSSFGRVDPIVGYQKTTRTFSLSFEVHAFAPEDLRVMYNKLTQLSSMCYPTFGTDGLLSSGPVTRMRVGDVASTDLGGVPGVIKGLSIDFGEALWELQAGMKVPRSFKVSLEFLTLHDGPVGIVNGRFGVYRLPNAASQGGDTNFADSPTDARSNGATSALSALPGGFSKFGEPRR